jgi:hypothetical protein
MATSPSAVASPGSDNFVEVLSVEHEALDRVHSGSEDGVGGRFAPNRTEPAVVHDEVECVAGQVPVDFFGAAADAAAACLPDAHRLAIEVAGHVADPLVLGPFLSRFYTG